MLVPFRVPSMVALAFVGVAAAATAQQTTRETVDSSGNQGNGLSDISGISTDGNVIGFASDADNLVTGDTNGRSDAFVRNRTTGVVTRVSVKSNGVEGVGPSYEPVPNVDGSVIVFYSDAKNLVSGDTNKATDVFVHEMLSGLTTRVSVDSSGLEANGPSGAAQISDDGNTIVYESDASNLVSNDTNTARDVFVFDRTTLLTTRVSVDSSGNEGNGASIGGRLSADGRYVLFTSVASNLVNNDTNGFQDTFLYDRQTGITELISVDSNGIQGNRASTTGTVSADGRYVVFQSDASNLILGDSNASADVFLRDRQTGTTTLVSADSAGAIGNKGSFSGRISDDGHYCAFGSSSTNLVSGDNNAVDDVFRKDLTTGLTTRVSVDSAGAEANGASGLVWVSGDGTVTGFSSLATNLVAGDTNGFQDGFIRSDCSPAAWFNYGAGWPGTLGTPTMTSSANPVFGSTITISITNSWPGTTPAILMIGIGEANIPTSKDGTLLVVPLLFIPLSLPFGGISLNGTLPTDNSLCGFEIDMQTLELDANSTKGMSFTDGLALVLGV